MVQYWIIQNSIPGLSCVQCCTNATRFTGNSMHKAKTCQYLNFDCSGSTLIIIALILNNWISIPGVQCWGSVHPHPHEVGSTVKVSHRAGVPEGDTNASCWAVRDVQCTTYVQWLIVSRRPVYVLVIQTEGVDVAGVVVAIHNVPGEGDVGVGLTDHLGVANMSVLSSCTATYLYKLNKGLGGLQNILGAFLVTDTI